MNCMTQNNTIVTNMSKQRGCGRIPLPVPANIGLPTEVPYGSHTGISLEPWVPFWQLKWARLIWPRSQNRSSVACTMWVLYGHFCRGATRAGMSSPCFPSTLFLFLSLSLLYTLSHLSFSAFPLNSSPLFSIMPFPKFSHSVGGIVLSSPSRISGVEP